MKTLTQHIEERLIINKNFKNIINDWTNVKDIFSITFNNTLKTVYLNVSCIKNEKEIEKITDNEFCFNGAQTLTNSTKSGKFKISNDKNFAYCTTDTSRYNPFDFSEFIIHPSNSDMFKELCNKVKCGKKYDYNYIISAFGLSKNDFPDNFFEHKSYKLEISQKDIDKFIEYIDEYIDRK